VRRKSARKKAVVGTPTFIERKATCDAIIATLLNRGLRRPSHFRSFVPSAEASGFFGSVKKVIMLDRRLYSNVPPPARTSQEDHPTLLVTYWCSIFALVIILVRLAGRYLRTEQLFREDKFMTLSIIPLLARLALIHVVLIFGTNNAITTGLGPEQIHMREIGSRLVLLSRIMYAAL
jgi:hypothetical protein